tara:strand:- start:780 stop:2126 length:1347 start_codon:yes stop_codon:yes gene_type:complete
MPDLELDKLYEFEIDNIAFGDLCKNKVLEIVSDGRVLSHLLEAKLDQDFDNLTHIKKCKTYDFIDREDNKLDEKTFTKGGCKFMPSGMIGKGRKYDEEIFKKYLEETKMRYILVDGTQLKNKKIRVKAFDGLKLFKCYPSASIPFKHIEFIFSNNQLNLSSLNNYKKMNKIDKSKVKKKNTKQTTGKNRNTIDKFYTNPSIVKKYIDKFKPYIGENDLIIEPSAGSGVWTTPLHMYNLIAFDIQPEGEGIQQTDFLGVDLYAFQSNLHFIGNPPFGRQSSLAKKFIKHICNCEKTLTIAFILPKSFKKDSFQSVFPPNYHLEYQDDVGKDAFTANGNPYDVPCVFQIWRKKETNRVIPEKLTPINFKFVKKTENPDYSLRRVGVYAGRLSKDIEDKSEQSHYFIKVEQNSDLFIIKYQNIKWEHNNTVGPKSISKQEFIREINKLTSP